MGCQACFPASRDKPQMRQRGMACPHGPSCPGRSASPTLTCRLSCVPSCPPEGPRGRAVPALLASHCPFLEQGGAQEVTQLPLCLRPRRSIWGWGEPRPGPGHTVRPMGRDAAHSHGREPAILLPLRLENSLDVFFPGSSQTRSVLRGPQDGEWGYSRELQGCSAHQATWDFQLCG